MGGYAPVGVYDDDELLKQMGYGGYAPVAPAPADISPAAVADASAPPVTSSAPLPAAGASATPSGSTEDLEARGLQSHEAPPVTPQAPRPSWGDYAPAEPHGAAKVGRMLAATFAPGLEHYLERPEQQAEQRYKNATAEYEAPIGEEEKESQAEQRESQAELEREQADTLRRTGGAKPGVTPEETTIHDLMTGESGGPRVNPETGKPYSYLEAYGAVEQSKAGAKPPKPDQPEQQFVDEYQKSHPGATVAEAQKEFKKNEQVREPGTFTPLYDQKTGGVVGAWNPQTGEVRHAPNALPGTTSPGVGIANRNDTANKKALEPLQGVLDEIDESREFAKEPSATNDYGLLMNFIGVTKPESLAKLRLNQNEVALAKGTRGALGDLEALGKKLENGQMLTADQRASMLKTMDTVEKFTRRRMEALNGGGQGGQGGGKEAPEGTRIQVGDQTQVKRNGKWVPEQ
jgi:hypothetical protein